MPLAIKLPRNSKTFFRGNLDIRSAKHRLRVPVKAFVAILIVAALFTLFIKGHPIISVWSMLAILGWLFIFGASKASERYPDDHQR